MPKATKKRKLNAEGKWTYGPILPPIIKNRPDAWSSGTHGPSWIQISFETARTITNVNAMVDQGCPGWRTDIILVTLENGHEIPIALWTGLRKQDALWKSKFIPVPHVKSLRVH